MTKENDPNVKQMTHEDMFPPDGEDMTHIPNSDTVVNPRTGEVIPPTASELSVDPAKEVTPGAYHTKLGQKILNVMAVVDKVEKTGYNEHQRYNYVPEAEIARVIRSAMIDNHLCVIPDMVSCNDSPAGTTKSGTQQFLTTVCIKFRLIDTDSGEWYDAHFFGAGIDMGDKGLYKAITGANKYFLLKTFQVPTEDDPETSSPQRTGGGGGKKSAPASQNSADSPCTDKQFNYLKGLFKKKQLEDKHMGGYDSVVTKGVRPNFKMAQTWIDALNKLPDKPKDNPDPHGGGFPQDGEDL